MTDTAETRNTLGLFDAFGIELEYMIVDRARLDVAPLCDRIMQMETGELTANVEGDRIDWSNELVLHVIELKTSTPAKSLLDLPRQFGEHVQRASGHAASLGARLLPTAMHPWMDPHTQTKLWPHEYGAVYKAFDRIFGCRGHGWSNLQSAHINLPFADDEEFGRLHAAIRVLLPILPAIAASSPIVEGRVTGMLDTRLEAYRNNCRRIPMVTGRVIPEPVFSIDAYHELILQRLYSEIAPHDPEGALQHEWLNARGAIARFDRGAIEIRVIDVQECPQMDLAIAQLAIAALRGLVEERWCSYETQKDFSVDRLADILDGTIVEAERARIEDREYLGALGMKVDSCAAGDVWRHLLEMCAGRDGAGLDAFADPLRFLLEEGTLARRILGAVGDEPTRETLHTIYAQLADCLATGSPFHVPPTLSHHHR